jgi:hypothetical protein
MKPTRIEQTPLGEAEVYDMPTSMIKACPHFIFVPEHYRDDGTCRCDDNSADNTKLMKEWGYTWDGKRWI